REFWAWPAETHASLFAVNADAWRRFCTGLGIAPDALTAANHRGWLLRHCEEKMSEHAPTTDALRARFRAQCLDVSDFVTADELLASWRDTLDEMTAGGSRVRRGGGGVWKAT